MATELWRELFVRSGVLDRLRAESLETSESLNIISVFEQTVFLWLSSEQHLITVAVKSLDLTDKEGLCDLPQTLWLSSPPCFDVENIQINGCGHLLCLSAKRGITIVQLPERWAGQDVFQGGKEKILCKSWNIADRFFSCNKRIKVLQASWHPGSNSHAHLVVLSNDNYFRIYNTVEPDTPLLAVPLSSQSQSYYLTSSSQTTFYDCLGEAAVSFDFGPPITQEDDLSNKDVEREDLIWPIFILNGNGDVFVLDTCLSRKVRNKKRQLLGPLSMHPPAEDNYGVDACNLICLQSTPPVLVITTCAGIVHHCIVLHSPDFQRQNDYEEFGITGTQADIGLFVFESVELSLSLTPGDEMVSYPVRLCKDPTLNHRYHCIHSAGLHVVQLPFLQHLEKFTCSEDTFDSNLLTELEERFSLVEHLICTRPFPSSPSAPLLGIAVASNVLGATLICLLSTFEAVFLPLRSCQPVPQYQLKSSNTLSTSLTNESEDNGFVQKLLQWLQCSTHTPLLKTPHSITGSEPSSQQCMELFGAVTQSFREEFLQRLQIAHRQLSKRVKVLNDQKSQLIKETDDLLGRREKLSEKAEYLAEKYEDINLKQHQLIMRVEKVTKHLQERVPVLSDEEANMQREIRNMQERLKHLNNELEQINQKFSFQRAQLEKDEEAATYRETTYNANISQNQSKQIKELLSKQSVSIAELIRRVTWLNKDLGIL